MDADNSIPAEVLDQAYRLYYRAEASGADYTRRRTVAHQLCEVGVDPEMAERAAEAVRGYQGDYEAP